MSLTPETRLGPYEIVAPLGAGGMGEVYRARDTRLDRDVAIKILPEAFARDAERLARFEREAKTLASLNHPHIAQIYGLEEGPEDAGHRMRALVMELVEGEDLSQRIARGPIPIDDALPIAKQIAEALEAAHDAGIVHRDLKPANIKVRANGTVKVLDFGLAKALGAAKAPPYGLANSPTIASPPATAAGIILGTAAYMSPEQARGKVADARADIWAFGSVLYEMLTGKPAFAGETVTDILAAIVHKAPDWTALPAHTPPGVRDVIERCLRKDPARRLHHLADARIVVEDALIESPSAATTGTSRARGVVWPAAVLAAIAAAASALAAWAVLSRPVAPAPVYSFTIPAAGFNTISNTAISHDGKWVAYSPSVAAGPFKLFVRALDSFDVRELASGTATGANPFFSPDDRWIAYFMDGVLYKVAVSGGAPERIATIAPGINNGAWGPDGTIVVSGNFRIQNINRRALATVPASGGELVTVTAPNPNESHLDPEILPDGKTVLFTVSTPQSASIAAASLTGGPLRIVVNDARTPKYSRTGHLVFQRASSGDLLGVRFDPDRLDTAGEVTRLSDVARVNDSAGIALASNGTLIYSAPADTAEQAGFTIVSVDRSGAETTVLSQPGSWASPRLSPDGRTVLYRSIVSPNCDLWTVDIARGTRTRVTFEGDNHDPIWRSDGQITWASQSTGTRGIRMARGDRPVQVTAIGEAPNERSPDSWSRDGRRLAFTEIHPATGRDLWVFSVESGEARPFATTRFNEHHAMFSPDGRWIAYVTDETGRSEVYIQRADSEGGRLEISANGGDSPLWSSDGKELFYAEGSQLMVVEIDARPSQPQASRPRILLRGPYVWERPANYDITQDGRRFLFIRRADGSDPSATLRVILNWPARLR